MAIPQQIASTAPGDDITVPTVAKLPRMHRCTASTQWGGRRRARRCLIFSDTALNGQVLCLEHLTLALLSATDRQVGGRGEYTSSAVDALTAECQLRGELLHETLDLLRQGIPDPAEEDRIVLAIVPAALVDRIQEAIEGGP